VRFRPRYSRTLLVVGAFVAAGATALPAVARLTGADQDERRFPGGRYFVIGCGFSHHNNDDAIALPGKPGGSHNHTYIGNRVVDAFTTPASLLGGDSSCGDAGDSSAYWVPTLYAGGRPLRPLAGAAYYVRRTSGPVQPLPAGLKMIAGDQRARRPQPLGVTGWGCGGLGATPRSSVIPACGPDESIHFRVTFQNCWNGKDIDSPDHKRHVAYAVAGRCPRSHPVAMPTIVLILLYPSSEHGRPLQASGRYGAHADFINGWEQETLARLVEALN
jgi:Domain of unknown function (DUF1996)